MKRELVSYWQECEKVYSSDEGMILVKGYYEGDKALGLQWNDVYPSAGGRLAPFCLDNEMGEFFF